MRLAALAAALGVLALAAAAPAHPPDAPFDDTIFAPIQPGGYAVALQPVATGLTAPLKGVTAPGDLMRLYVVEQTGQVWALDPATGERTLFLDVSSRLVPLGIIGPGSFDERGLLGLAFHPRYALNGKLYTYTSEPAAGPPTLPSTLPPGVAPNHQSVLSEWTASPSAALVDLTSRRELMRIDQPQFNHDGGELAFGPDGMLYISLGDGGAADDQGVGHHPVTGNAQRLDNPLGKILRIDVDATSGTAPYGIPADNPFVGMPGVVEEIYAFGFRNPFRMSFDRATGDLYVGDVGQNDIEEVDLVVKGGNYGWNAKEGTLFFHPRGPAEPGFAGTEDNGRTSPDMIDPIAQYDTHHEGHSVIGGFVYRGSALPQIRGRYVFGDFARQFRFPAGPNDSGRLFTLQQRSGTGLREINEFVLPGQKALGKANLEGTEGIGLALLGFGQDTAGELYVLGNITGTPFGSEGKVMKIVPRR